MASKDPVTRILITAKDEASSVFEMFKRNVGAIAASIAAYFSFDLFKGALSSASDFETAMSRVQAASGGSAAELKLLRDAALEAGSTTEYSAVQAAGALELLVKSGLSASDAVATLPAALNLAKAGGVELGQAAKFIAKAVNGMGLSFADAGRVADVLSTASRASLTSLDDLGGALSKVAPIAQASNVSLEQTVAMLGLLTHSGMDAETAGAGLARIMGTFANPASAFRSALAAAGITTGNFGEALTQLQDSGAKGEKAIVSLGLRGGSALRALVEQGSGALKDVTTGLENAGGAAEKTATILDKNLSNAWEVFGNALTNLKIKLVDPLLKPLRDELQLFAEKLNDFASGGTLTSFGETIRDAFVGAVKWVREFISAVDFKQVAADIKTFVSDAGTWFAKFTLSAQGMATDTGNAFKGLSITVSFLATGLYTLISVITQSLSMLVTLAKETLSVINVGGILDGSIAKLSATAEILGNMSDISFSRGAASAEAFNQKVTALTEAQAAATEAANKQADATKGSGTAMEGTAGSLDKFSKGQSAAEIATKKTTEELKKQQELSKAAAADVEAAYTTLGVTSKATLIQLADNAKAAFETIRLSGTAAPEDISNAYIAYSEKVLSANNKMAAGIKAVNEMSRIGMDKEQALNDLLRKGMTPDQLNADKFNELLDHQDRAKAAYYAHNFDMAKEEADKEIALAKELSDYLGARKASDFLEQAFADKAAAQAALLGLGGQLQAAPSMSQQLPVIQGQGQINDISGVKGMPGGQANKLKFELDTDSLSKIYSDIQAYFNDKKIRVGAEIINSGSLGGTPGMPQGGGYPAAGVPAASNTGGQTITLNLIINGRKSTLFGDRDNVNALTQALQQAARSPL